MQLIIILQIVFKLIIHIFFCKDDFKFKDTFLIWNLNTKNSHDIGLFNKKLYHISNQYNFISSNKNKYEMYSFCKTHNNQLEIQLENNNINALYLFYDKKNQFITNTQKISYFLQLGLQNIFENKIINLGIGKRYIQSNLYGIGYNAICNIPILPIDHVNLPYSLNIGGEYWYRNFIFLLNGYYNLNNFLYPNEYTNTNYLEYPIAGYQIRIQTPLPHVSEFRAQIKLEKFFYTEKFNKLFNNINDNFYSLSIGLGYKPNSILDISIDNVFINTKYTNFLFKIALNYKFNTLFSHQIKQKCYNNASLNLNNYLNSMIKSFTPNSNDIKTYDNTCNVSKTTYKIIGHSKETKYIKINSTYKTSLQWNTISLERNGGKITYLTNHLYKIHLPKYNPSGNNKILLVYKEKDNNNKIINKQKILIFIKQFEQDNIHEETHNVNPAIIQSNTQHAIDINDKNLSQYDQHHKNIHESYSDNSFKNNVTEFMQHTILNNTQKIQEEKSLNAAIFSHDNTNLSIPVPPPMPKPIECIIQPNKKIIPITTLVSYQNEHAVSSLTSTNLTQNITDQTPSSSNFLQQRSSTSFLYEEDMNKRTTVHPSSVKTKDENYNTNTNNNDNFSYQLLKQKHSKFSSVGTKEYMNKLEHAITERKKVQYTTEIGKMFNKLHQSFSCSSIEESLDTDDDYTDSFSESSKN